MRLPGAKIPFQRQTLFEPQPIENLAVRRPCVEKGGVEQPELFICRIAIDELLRTIENGDGAGHLVQRAPMRLHLSFEIRAHRFDFLAVDGDCGRRLRGRGLDHVEQMPAAGDDCRHPLAPNLRFRPRLGGRRARRLVQQFDLLVENFLGVFSFHRLRISAVDENESPASVAQPDRQRQGFEETSQTFDIGMAGRAALAQADQFELVAGDLAQSQNSATADRAAFGVKVPTSQSDQRDTERLAPTPQAIDLMFEFLRRLRRQPRAEGEDAPRRRHVGDQLRRALDIRLARRAFPSNEQLLLAGQKNLGAVALRARMFELCRQLRFAAAPSLALRKVSQRDEAREQSKATAQREPVNFDVWSEIRQKADGFRMRFHGAAKGPRAESDDPCQAIARKAVAAPPRSPMLRCERAAPAKRRISLSCHTNRSPRSIAGAHLNKRRKPFARRSLSFAPENKAPPRRKRDNQMS